MRRIFLLLALVLVVGGGSVVAVAQSGNSSQTTEEDTGADAAGCATPVGSPDAADIADMIEEVAASPEVTDALATAIATPNASPMVPVSACATPEMGTPAS